MSLVWEEQVMVCGLHFGLELVLCQRLWVLLTIPLCLRRQSVSLRRGAQAEPVLLTTSVAPCDSALHCGSSLHMLSRHGQGLRVNLPSFLFSLDSVASKIPRPPA